MLKKALSHDGLSRGLHEVVRALEKGQAQLVVLAEDCNQPDYKKLVEALCAEQSANLLSVKEAQQLGTWAGVCTCPELAVWHRWLPCLQPAAMLVLCDWLVALQCPRFTSATLFCLMLV